MRAHITQGAAPLLKGRTAHEQAASLPRTTFVHTRKSGAGFTLIEIMVAVAVFSVVMMIAVGALITIINANRKAQALQSAMTNLNFALESMVREIRVGTNYHCRTGVAFQSGSLSPSQLGGVKNCNNNGKLIAFEKSDGDPGDLNDQAVYRFNNTNNKLERSLDGGVTFVALTAPEVEITNFELRVRDTGQAPGNTFQPTVRISIEGEAGPTERTKTTFRVQAFATQRLLDL